MTQDLIKGARDFKHYHYEKNDDLMETLVREGQDPKYFIISCIDSRCNPATIFKTKPGSFFAHKTMGAITPTYEQGTALTAHLEFALNYDNVDTIIILGHTQCGAIKALVNDIDNPEIANFIHNAKPAFKKAKSCCHNNDDLIIKTEQEVILQSIENLKTYPCVQQALKENRLMIIPWQFDLVTGSLLEFNKNTKIFESITEEQS